LAARKRLKTLKKKKKKKQEIKHKKKKKIPFLSGGFQFFCGNNVFANPRDPHWEFVPGPWNAKMAPV